MTQDAKEIWLGRWRLAGYRAKCFLQGSALDAKTGKPEPISGAWSTRLASHPWVKIAEVEGWSKELRGALYQPIRLKIMNSQSTDNLDELMPNERWFEYIREEARKYDRAKAWQDAVIAEYGTMPRYTSATAHQVNSGLPVQANRRTTFSTLAAVLAPLKTSRPEFEAMQQSSPNMHMAGKGR